MVTECAVPAVSMSDKEPPAATYMPPLGPAVRSVTLTLPGELIGVIVPGVQLVGAFEARPSRSWSATHTTPSEAIATAVGWPVGSVNAVLVVGVVDAGARQWSSSPVFSTAHTVPFCATARSTGSLFAPVETGV